MFKFDYVGEYKSHYLMFMSDVEKYTDDYYKKLDLVMENESHSFEYLMRNNDELTNKELLEELNKTLDYMYEMRSSLTLGDSCKFMDYYEKWIEKYEKTIDKTRETIRLEENREKHKMELDYFRKYKQ